MARICIWLQVSGYRVQTKMQRRLSYAITWHLSKKWFSPATLEHESFEREPVITVAKERCREAKKNDMWPDRFLEIQKTKREPKEQEDIRPSYRDTEHEHESREEFDDESTEDHEEGVKWKESREVVDKHDIERELTVDILCIDRRENHADSEEDAQGRERVRHERGEVRYAECVRTTSRVIYRKGAAPENEQRHICAQMVGVGEHVPPRFARRECEREQHQYRHLARIEADRHEAPYNDEHPSDSRREHTEHTL